MTPTGKTQPQELLESILPIETRNESEKYPGDPEPLGKGETKFPTIEEQQKYWADKKKAEEPKPRRKWSLARRRKFNATHAKKKLVEHPMYDYPPTDGQLTAQESEPTLRFCPCCGRNIERWLS